MSDLNWTLDGPTGSVGLQTDWFAVKAAGQTTPEGAEALEKLCRAYWYPLYAYIRRRGHEPSAAQDLTQEFFLRLLKRPWPQDLHPSKGKFRSFLLASMNHFLANEWRREQAQKRGSGREVTSLEVAIAEERYRLEAAHSDSPESVFESRWADALLQRVVAQLTQEYQAAGKEAVFEQLKGMLVGEDDLNSYRQVADRLGTTEAAVKKSAQRLRDRYRELLRAEVAQTVTAPGEVDEEIHYLFSVLRR
jgi:RNA polymerase sigma factor (sigma-70 family)